MTELDKIIAGMNPKLFSDNLGDSSINEKNEENAKVYMEENYVDNPVIHQETIPNELARSLLLPKDYDENCSYQIVTMNDATILLRIDDSIPVENDNLPDDEQNPVRRHITEFPLESPGEVQSYTQMVQDILNPKPLPSAATYRAELLDEETTSYRWWIIPAILFMLLLTCGCGLLYFVINYL